MIKNVIFDYGQVLIKFEPEYMCKKYTENDEDCRLLANVLFDRVYWNRLDAGTIEDEEVLRLASERLPERLHKSVSDAYYNWIYNTPIIDGMEELILKIKERYKVRIFLISNISKYFASHKDEFPILKHMEYSVFSASVGMTKPNKEIFIYLLDACKISAEECIFIDDNVKNTRAAEELGIKAYTFDGNVEKLTAFLDKSLSISI